MRSRLRGGEEVAAIIRRHWVDLGGPFALLLFLLGASIAAWFVERPYVFPAALAAFAAAAAWASWRWLAWSSDLWVVTTQRVIDESGVLSVRVVDSPLDKIHNVACEQSLWGRTLGFGTLALQTGAESGMTVIERVARPFEAKDAILDSQERYRGRAPGGAREGADTRDCPHCAETIKVKATVCRYCGRPV